ncbi:MAG TPA: BamA/TamA family outer membrane protein, partial [Vicinamibacteria bacterium]|nr:BamA/TamA family outer membrane protein [Vicinamibacteria bacterium]
ELLFSTGEFEDVAIEREDGPEGLVVAIRPRPSPRLLEVRVEGNAVRSARQLRALARLRVGEPLWPRRLEDASRDVTRALVAAGYLEARVTAEARPAADPFLGADLVFHVHSGPRARVVKLVFEGTSILEEGLLAGLGRPRPGRPFVRAEADKAAAAMRRRLVAAGRWGASVDVRDSYDPSTAQVDIVFAVHAGPITVVEMEGSSFPGALVEDVEEILREGGLRKDAQEEAGERLEAELRRRGHRDAQVLVREEARPFGIAVVCEARPGPRTTVASVGLEGFDGPYPTLGTRVGAPVEETVLQEDVRILTRTLEDRGYSGARVESVVAEGGGEIPVLFRANPGSRSVIDTFVVESPITLPPDQSRPELRTRVGQPYRLRELAADRNTLLAAYRDAGYLDAAVTPDVAFSEDRSLVRVTLRVTPGTRAELGTIVVSGLRRTREEVVRRELTLEEGKALGFGRLLESQKRLGALGIFDRVSIAELGGERGGPHSVVIVADEAPRTTFSYGLGYSEREYARGSLEVTRRNLGGLDRTLTAYARGSFRGNRLLLGYREPYLFGHKRDLYLAAFREEEDRTGFDFKRTGMLAQTLTRLGAHTSLSLRYTYQDTRVFDLEIPLDEVDRQFRTYTLSGPSVSLVKDQRDDALDPRRGLFLGADVQSSLSFLGGASFVKGFLQAATYRRLRPKLTLALSGRVGLARTFGLGEPEQLPLPERFFAGGDYGPRGFKTDFAGPTEEGSTDELLPTGGNALLFGGVEVRYDVGPTLSLAAFSDAGTVYPRVSDIDLSEVFYTTGLGVRYRTPVGPVRVDWGYKLNRRPNEGAYRIHVTIGHAF